MIVEGQYAYLILMLVFAGIPVLLEFIFGYHFFKPFFRKIAKVVLVGVLITPLIEFFALEWNSWEYDPDKHLGFIILKSPIETLILAVLISLAVAFAVTAWTFYEDKGKPIFRTSLYDVFHATYAIWRKNSKKDYRS